MADENSSISTRNGGFSPLNLAPYLGMFGLFLAVELLAVAIAPTFDAAGLQATQNPGNPVNSIVYVVFILAFTAVLLAAIKYGQEKILQFVVLGSVAYLVFFLLSVLLPFPAAVAVSIGIAALLYIYPEWYVINAAGVLMGASGAGLFGISFGILPAVILLAILAVYDAIAVYRTEHMLTLAGGVMDLNLPVMFVIPKKLSYSFIEATQEQEQKQKQEQDNDSERKNRDSTGEDGHSTDDGDKHPVDEEERDAFFLGLGDAVIPTVLIASGAQFIDAPLAANYAVHGALLGSLVGLTILMYQVSKGKAHAGLPLLNGGTIIGFFAGGLAMGLTPTQLLF